MGLRFNPPPNWPPPPPGFVPPPRWQPDPSWPPPPPGWQVWIPDDTDPEAPARPGDFAEPADFPPGPPDYLAGPAGPAEFAAAAGPAQAADYPAWSGDFAADSGDSAADLDDFPGGPGDFPGGPGDFSGRGDFPGGPTITQDPFGPPPQPYHPRGSRGAHSAAGTSDQTNGFAIASFLLGLLGFGFILSYVFGVVALRQIRDSGQRGKGLAITGLALSGVWTLLLVGLLLMAATSPSAKQPASAGTGSSPPGTSHGSPGSTSGASPGSSSGGSGGAQTTNVFSLHNGECFQNPANSQAVLGITYVTAVPCTTAHNAQVFVQFPVTGTRYPGSTSLKRLADIGCRSRIAKNVQKSKITSTMTLRYLYPLPTSWATGHRAISCLIVDAKPDLKASLLRSGH